MRRPEGRAFSWTPVVLAQLEWAARWSSNRWRVPAEVVGNMARRGSAPLDV